LTFYFLSLSSNICKWLGKVAVHGAASNDDDDDGTVQSEWERQFDERHDYLERMSFTVVQLHETMSRLVVAIRDEANRLRTCGTA